jgi:Flp pilus assembly protein TadG
MLRRLPSDTRGMAAVEFAMIAPVMLLIVMGTIEFGYVSSARSALEAAVIRGARQIAASDCPAQRETILRTTVTNAMAHVASADGAAPRIESKAYAGQFGDVGEPEPFNDLNSNQRWDTDEPFTDVNGNTRWDADMGTSGSVGGAGQVVSYTATYNVRSLVPYVARLYSELDHHPIRATTVVRNEPLFRNTGCT